MDLFTHLSIKPNIYSGERKLSSFTSRRAVKNTNMIKFTRAYLKKCIAVLITVHLFVPSSAFKKTSNMDEFMVENQRTRMRQNYVLQRALNNDVDDKIGVTYVTEPLNPNTNPEELPALIVDYANMIRNDIILLDNSVETRTRKRGNIKVEKYNHGGIKDIPCSCELESKEPKILGEDYFPPAIETRNCDERLCPSPYGCKERYHNITVLKRKRYIEEPSQEVLPEDLKKRWIAIKKPVIVGCMCVRDF